LAVAALGFAVSEVADAQVAVVDARDRDQVMRASSMPPSLARVTIVARDDHAFIAALGIDGSRIVNSAEAAILGPALLALVPNVRGRASAVVAITASRGGI